MGVCTQICSMPTTLLEIPTSILSRRPPLQQKVLLQSCLVLAQCYASHLLCWSTALVGRPQCSPLENLLLVPLCLLDSLLQPKPPLTNAVSSSPHYSCLGGGWVANIPKIERWRDFERKQETFRSPLHVWGVPCTFASLARIVRSLLPFTNPHALVDVELTTYMHITRYMICWIYAYISCVRSDFWPASLLQIFL